MAGQPERLLALEGTLNFRDLGGYATDRGTVAWGRVYRADGLAALSDDDHRVLRERKLRLVCDLRHDGEVQSAPDRLPEGLRYHRTPIGPDGDWQSLEQLIADAEIRRVTLEDVAGGYRQMLVRHAATFGEAVSLVADPSNHPVVFHCTAGKDRTGIAAALILSALGVAAADVVADYALTNEYRTEHRIAELQPLFTQNGIAVADVLSLFSAPPDVMERTLAHLREEYGSTAEYLTGTAGVDPEAIRVLRQSLVGG